MPNPQYVSVSSSTISSVINMDYRGRNPMNAAVAVTIASSGTATYSVQYTLDDPQYLSNIPTLSSRVTAGPTWFTDANLSGASSNGTTNYMFPVAGLRLNVSAASSAVITMCVIQAGP